MKFKATLDKTAKVVTLVITLLFLGIAFLPILLGKNEIPVLLIVFLFSTYGITYAFSPNGYEVNENNIIIKRPFNTVAFNRTQIKELVKIEDRKLYWAIRTFGVGGLFGYFGAFWNKEFGSMTWYATRREDAIMIITHKNKKIIITPDDVEKFIREFKAL